jgi:hypothetical protein
MILYNKDLKQLIIKKNLYETNLDQLYESGNEILLRSLNLQMFNNFEPHIFSNKGDIDYINEIHIYSPRLYLCIKIIIILNFVKINHKKYNKKYNNYEKNIYDDKKLYNWLDMNYKRFYNLLKSEVIIL